MFQIYFNNKKKLRQSFVNIIGEAIHNHVTEVPAIEVIGILETAKACVIQQAIKEL